MNTRSISCLFSSCLSSWHGRPARGYTASRAFSLVELLVVIVILALLIAMTLTVGAKMVNTGKRNQTENTIRTLEAALDAYITKTGAIPSPVADYPEHVREYEKGDRELNEIHALPVSDVVSAHGPAIIDPAHLINATGLLLQQFADVPGADELIKTIDPALIKPFNSFNPPEETGGHANIEEVLLPTPIDGWGNPIRYVHPALDGVVDDGKRGEGEPGEPTHIEDYFPSVSREFFVHTYRRNKIEAKEHDTIPIEHRDSDGGQCPTDRPYFYSPGPDGDPSTTDDNVYVTMPKFVKQID